MTRGKCIRSFLLSTVAPAVLAAASMATTSPALAQCAGPGTQTSEGKTPQTTCVTAIPITGGLGGTGGTPLRSFDISWSAPDLGFYFLGDRSNNGVDIIDAVNLLFIGTYTSSGDPTACPNCKFTGVKCTVGSTVVPCTSTVAVNNNISGPDGVTQFGLWVYAGDGDSTVKVIDLTLFPPNGIVQSISTGGSTRVDEMALNTDGTLLLAANNAEDPPFATLFNANGNNPPPSNVTKIIKVNVANSIIPEGAGLSLEQPAWEPTTQRFYTSIPVIKDNPRDCNFGQDSGTAIDCDGGLLVTDPNNLSATQCDQGFTPGVLCTQGAFNTTTKTGVIFLHAASGGTNVGHGCAPNGATVGPDANLLLGCTPGNNPFSKITQVINANTRNFADIANITGSDEVWFNPSISARALELLAGITFVGDNRYYLGASKSFTKTPVCTPKTDPFAPVSFCAVLGVVSSTGVLIETIPQSSNSHSVAADAATNLIFVPQVAPTSVVGSGGDTTTVGQQLCGGTNGCVVVYQSGLDSTPPTFP
jgi:hypothetical protein